MKAVIDGITYNTETASKIAYSSKEFGANDFRHVEESLYRTEDGRFFLAGGGGPMTRYSRPAGDRQSGGSGIVVLTPDKARNWCESHGVDAETIAEHFKVEA